MQLVTEKNQARDSLGQIDPKFSKGVCQWNRHFRLQVDNGIPSIVIGMLTA